ncbi:hypothetical protein ACF2JD_08950 [Aeromonas sp. A-5]
MLRYLAYAFLLLLILRHHLLLWQAPNLIQRHLPGWLASTTACS